MGSSCPWICYKAFARSMFLFLLYIRLADSPAIRNDGSRQSGTNEIDPKYDGMASYLHCRKFFHVHKVLRVRPLTDDAKTMPPSVGIRTR